jgi:hypothetical protein
MGMGGGVEHAGVVIAGAHTQAPSPLPLRAAGQRRGNPRGREGARGTGQKRASNSLADSAGVAVLWPLPSRAALTASVLDFCFDLRLWLLPLDAVPSLSAPLPSDALLAELLGARRAAR